MAAVITPSTLATRLSEQDAPQELAEGYPQEPEEIQPEALAVVDADDDNDDQPAPTNRTRSNNTEPELGCDPFRVT